jgi:hypothetical protein
MRSFSRSGSGTPAVMGPISRASASNSLVVVVMATISRGVTLSPVAQVAGSGIEGAEPSAGSE